jgi:hypothetical protein
VRERRGVRRYVQQRQVHRGVPDAVTTQRT